MASRKKHEESEKQKLSSAEWVAKFKQEFFDKKKKDKKDSMSVLGLTARTRCVAAKYGFMVYCSVVSQWGLLVVPHARMSYCEAAQTARQTHGIAVQCVHMFRRRLGCQRTPRQSSAHDHALTVGADKKFLMQSGSTEPEDLLDPSIVKNFYVRPVDKSGPLVYACVCVRMSAIALMCTSASVDVLKGVHMCELPLDVHLFR